MGHLIFLDCDFLWLLIQYEGKAITSVVIERVYSILPSVFISLIEFMSSLGGV